MNNDHATWFELKALEHLLHRRVNRKVRAMGIDDVTLMHSYIIHFLQSNQDHDIYQKDLEKKFHFTRSSITNIVQHLEKKGYIKRESVPSDARLKKLTLTPEGLELDAKISSSMEETNEYLNSLLSPEETEIFFQVCQKLRTTLEADGGPLDCL